MSPAPGLKHEPHSVLRTFTVRQPWPTRGDAVVGLPRLALLAFEIGESLFLLSSLPATLMSSTRKGGQSAPLNAQLHREGGQRLAYCVKSVGQPYNQDLCRSIR